MLKYKILIELCGLKYVLICCLYNDCRQVEVVLLCLLPVDTAATQSAPSAACRHSSITKCTVCCL